MREAIVTHHAKKRCKQRLGLPKRAVQRMADKALNEGFPSEKFRGAFGQYLALQAARYGNTIKVIVCNMHIFFFEGDILITVYIIPEKFRNPVRDPRPKDEYGEHEQCV